LNRDVRDIVLFVVVVVVISLQLLVATRLPSHSKYALLCADVGKLAVADISEKSLNWTKM
jgi:hypothetical protein